MADLAVASTLAAVYSTSLLYAGFIGLGALWASSAIGYGGGGKQGHRGGYRAGGLGGRYRGGGYSGGYGGGYRGGHASYHRGYRSYGRSDGRFDPPDVKGIKPIFVKKTLPSSNDDLEKTYVDDDSVKVSVKFTKKVHGDHKNTIVDPKLLNKGTKKVGQTSHFSATKVDSTKTPKTSTLSKRTRRGTDDDWKPFRVSELGEDRKNSDGNYRHLSFTHKDQLDLEQIWVSHTEPEEERLLRAIRDSDTDNCELRLVCELAAIWNRPLTREEWEILRFVRNGDELFNMVYPGKGVGPDSVALHDYNVAAHYGEGGGACELRFRKCRFGADQIMKLVTGLIRL